MVRPKGVTLVAVLTLLSSGALFFFFMLIYAVSAVGGMSNPPMTGISLWSVWFEFVPLCLSGFAFIFSVGMLKGVRIVWYGSMVFWVVVLLYFGWYAYFINSKSAFAHDYEYQIALATVVPLIYGVACLAYFWTDGVRKYFRVQA